MSSRKLILVIGATGAQGLAVIDALLKPAPDGSPSPYSVRALTRNPKGERAQELARKGVEVVQGSTSDFPSVLAALEGAYGAYVNTDSFTIGQVKEVFAGIRIFELAKQAGTIKHYVWSSLDKVFKKGGYDPKYYAEHYTAKARVADWMRSQESIVSDEDMSWSVLTSGPYMDMLNMGMFGPINVRADGTHVFASPVGPGHVPMIALQDLGFFARYIFDHRAETSRQELEVASDYVGWDYLVKTFTKVTGKKAEYVPLSIEEWTTLVLDVDHPIASEQRRGDGTTTWGENFTRWWQFYRDDLAKRDFASLRRINPGLLSVEDWMRSTNYTGEIGSELLKNDADGTGGVKPDFERIAQL
ncbi:NAD-P-binding protein [Polyporus arcularius HHB13444]|uniref:NAD-P-binding protein n=1 Tax=Polyporus arcularius HHB13444 TaxID=1314778 RepID=A0A5C3NQG7_9APHY|nr:NAD-P-binding protein [Polyporus arcularius HHB13444]